MAVDDHVEQATMQRAANETAKRAGIPLPFPNVWDALDPTKVEPDAGPEAFRASYLAFRRICRPRPCKRHTL